MCKSYTHCLNCFLVKEKSWVTGAESSMPSHYNLQRLKVEFCAHVCWESLCFWQGRGLKG